jgi:3D-(3,5/4)-trihydroxycyclohexane-1,2-dione acylhydrolase (decyclizing)
MNAGPVGVTGCTSANELAGAADVILAVGTRCRTSRRFVDRVRRRRPVHRAQRGVVRCGQAPLAAVVADAREGLRELDRAADRMVADEEWILRAKRATATIHAYIDKIADPDAVGASGRRPTPR